MAVVSLTRNQERKLNLLLIFIIIIFFTIEHFLGTLVSLLGTFWPLPKAVGWAVKRTLWILYWLVTLTQNARGGTAIFISYVPTAHYCMCWLNSSVCSQWENDKTEYTLEFQLACRVKLLYIWVWCGWNLFSHNAICNKMHWIRHFKKYIIIT